MIHVDGFPRGSMFNKSSFNGSVWTFTGPDFGEVELTLPQFFSGEITFKLSAVAVNSGTLRESTLSFMVEAVANPPILTVREACFNLAMGNISLPIIDNSLVNKDGSETLTIILSNNPEGVTSLVGEVKNAGEYILPLDDLANTTLKFGATGSIEAFNITVSAMSTKMMNSAKAYTNTSLLIQECDVCEQGMHNCAQLCMDMVGSFKCDCNPGYELDSNGYSCNGEFNILL